MLGLTIDDAGSVANLPMEGLTEGITDAVSRETPDKKTFDVQYKPNGLDLSGLAAEVLAVEPASKPAKALWDGTEVVTQPETVSRQLDVQAVPDAGITAIKAETPVELPLQPAAKRIDDAALSGITDVVSQYSTHFLASNHPRCGNIKLASSKLRGVIVMPGERFSFNGTVGRRTLKAGFQLAGVYKNGKHDVGIGGGICQVSTTLYNAFLLGDFKIRQRSNHSLPVAYVPLGRDATVDYGDLDLAVENNYSTPIAIDSTYQPGRLTFRILGKRDPDLKVKIIQSGLESWEPDTETVVDRQLKPGARRIIEPGSSGHAVSTYRLVYHAGKLVRREGLGHCTYGGQTRVVAINPAPPVPVVPAQPGIATGQAPPVPTTGQQ